MPEDSREVVDPAGEAGARQHRLHQAVGECARALLGAAHEGAVDTALRALLEATDASFVFLERNIEHPDLGWCAELVLQVSDDDAIQVFPYWQLVPWSELPHLREVLGGGDPAAFNVADLPERDRLYYESGPDEVLSELDLPIFIDGRWLGVVGFAESRIERAWDESDLLLLGAAAGMIGAFWERTEASAMLESETEERRLRLRYERALADCSKALLSGQTDEALGLALDVLLEATDVSAVFVERNVDDPELGLCSSLVADRAKPPIELDYEYWEAMPWSRMPLAYEQLSKGLPAEIIISELEGVEAEAYSGSLSLSELNIPILVGGEWSGLIAFSDNETERHWSEEDIQLLTTAADMIGAYWERQEAYERLEELIRSKDEFIASVSHELRTPLTAVVGLSNELQNALDRYSMAEVAEFVGIITHQSAEVANMVEDLLVAARADIDRLAVVPEAVELRREIESVIAGLDAETAPSVEGPELVALADPARLRQVLRNLLTNAYRYGGDRVRVELGETAGWSVVSVADNGEGIPLADRARIFEAYESAHGRDGQPASVGLGLTVSKRLAVLMGGDLTYDFEDGWSRFRLQLPGSDGRAEES